MRSCTITVSDMARVSLCQHYKLTCRKGTKRLCWITSKITVQLTSLAGLEAPYAGILLRRSGNGDKYDPRLIADVILKIVSPSRYNVLNVLVVHMIDYVYARSVRCRWYCLLNVLFTHMLDYVYARSVRCRWYIGIFRVKSIHRQVQA